MAILAIIASASPYLFGVGLVLFVLNGVFAQGQNKFLGSVSQLSGSGALLGAGCGALAILLSPAGVLLAPVPSLLYLVISVLGIPIGAYLTFKGAGRTLSELGNLLGI